MTWSSCFSFMVSYFPSWHCSHLLFIPATSSLYILLLLLLVRIMSGNIYQLCPTTICHKSWTVYIMQARVTDVALVCILTFCSISKLVADHHGIVSVPEVITHGPPLPIDADLHSPLICHTTPGQPHLSCLTWPARVGCCVCLHMMCVCVCVYMLMCDMH